MTDAEVMHIAVQAMVVGVKVAGPILAVSLIVGFIVSLLQSVTQVQEMTLTFVPKVVVCAIILLMLGNWMMGELVTFTQQMFLDLPAILSK